MVTTHTTGMSIYYYLLCNQVEIIMSNKNTLLL